MHGAIVADALPIPFVPVLLINRRQAADRSDRAKTNDIALPNHRLWLSSVKGELFNVVGIINHMGSSEALMDGFFTQTGCCKCADAGGGRTGSGKGNARS